MKNDQEFEKSVEDQTRCIGIGGCCLFEHWHLQRCNRFRVLDVLGNSNILRKQYRLKGERKCQ